MAGYMYVPGWFYNVMSLRLIAALEDLGVTELIIGRRRHTFLQEESADTLTYQIRGTKCVCYHFGSMTEGTTTPAMGSDIDTLICDDSENIMSGLPDWKRGRSNLLMVKHATCSPQHYRLQEIRSDLPLPLTLLVDEFCVRDADGKIYRSNRDVGAFTRQLAADINMPYFNAGPSHSVSEMFDFVIAYRCETLPAECESFFTRPRHGVWHKKCYKLRENLDVSSYLTATVTVNIAHWNGVYPQVSLSDISCLACILYISTLTFL